MNALSVSLAVLALAPLTAANNRHGSAIAGSLMAIATVALCIELVTLSAGATFTLDLPMIGGVPGFAVNGQAPLFTLVTSAVFVVSMPFIVHDAERLPSGRRVTLNALLALTLAAMLGAFFAADVATFIVSWEIAALAIWGLIGFDTRDGRPVAAGLLTVASSEAGSLAGLAGLMLLSASTGSLSLAVIAGAAPGLPGSIVAIACILTFFGFGMKAGIIPLNLWLPPAHAGAPRSISPILSGATLNLGLFAFLRIDGPLALTNADLGLMMLVTGALTALVGMVYAVSERDMKRLLAQSSIENIGITTAAFGAGLAFAALGKPIPAGMALVAGLYHMVNHSSFKTLLFIGAGAVDEATGTHDLDRLGGLMRRLPVFGVLFLVGSVAIAALPPFNGFVSEWLTLESLLRVVEVGSIPVRFTFALSGAALALTAGLALTCFTLLAGTSLLGVARSEGAAKPGTVPASAMVPMSLLALGCLLLGIGATAVIPVLGPVVAPLAGADPSPHLVPSFFGAASELPHAVATDLTHIGARLGAGWLPVRGLVVLHSGGMHTPVVFAMSTALSAIVISFIFLVVWGVTRGLRRTTTVVRGVWDAGLASLRPEMTYNATAFASPVRVLFDAVFRPVITSEKQHLGEFVTANHYEASPTQIIERVVIRPCSVSAAFLSRSLARLHQGQVTAYAGYVLCALVATLLISRALL